MLATTLKIRIILSFRVIFLVQFHSFMRLALRLGESWIYEARKLEFRQIEWNEVEILLWKISIEIDLNFLITNFRLGKWIKVEKWNLIVEMPDNCSFCEDLTLVDFDANIRRFEFFKDVKISKYRCCFLPWRLFLKLTMRHIRKF